MWTQGTVLGGRYTLTQRVGGGAMGDVWRAEDRVLERRVAVKILLPSLLEDNAFAARFRREAKVLANLDHPGIVDVYDYGEEEVDAGTQVAYIVMEFVEGRPLDALLRERGPLPSAEAMAIAAQTLDALHGAHRRKVVHRDIKPANLMVGEDGRVTVTDFGIARALTATKLTTAREVLGTALYIAPESAEGIATAPASDLYSVGVVLYEMLTGECPFTGEALLEIVLKHISEPAPALPEGFPEPVRELVARALQKRPEDRFPSAAAMAEAARRATAGQGAAEQGAAEQGAAEAGPGPVLGGTGGAEGGTALLGGAAGPAVAGTTPTGADGADAAGATDGGAVVVPPLPGGPPAVDPVVVVQGTSAQRDPRRRRPRFVLPLVIPLVIASTAGTVLLLAPSTGQAGAPSGPPVSTGAGPGRTASTSPTGSASPPTPTASTSARTAGGSTGATGGSTGGITGGAAPAPAGAGTGTGSGTNNGAKGGTTGGTQSGGSSSGSAGTPGGSSSGGPGGGTGRIGSAGTYRIKDAADGGCLEQDTSSGAPSAYAVSSSCGSGPSPYAEWTFTPGPNGTFKVINRGSGDCLTAFMANGWANMDACGSTSGQYWQIGAGTSSGSTLESTTYWQCLQMASSAEVAPCDSTAATQLWTDAGSN